MEESEALCERVGIFVSGRLRNVGTPAGLKFQFGQSLKLTMTTDPADEDKAFGEIKRLSPSAVIYNIPVEGTRNYQLPRSEARLSDIFSLMHKLTKIIRVQEWGVSSVTLEDVFLKVAHDYQKATK